MKLLLTLAFFALSLLACNDDKPVQPESTQDAARVFIRYALDGKYDKLSQMVIHDSANDDWLQRAEAAYRNNSKEDQRAYRESQIIIHETKQLNDSVSVITYSNTFKNQPAKLWVRKRGDDWLIDLKQSFEVMDSVSNNP